MATIAKLIIEGIFDPDGVKKGMLKALNDVQKFKKAVGNNAAQLKVKFPELAEGLEVQKSISKFQRIMDQTIAESRENLFLNKLNKGGFDAAVKEASKSFNEKVLKEIDALAEKGTLTPNIYRSLVGQLRTAGLDGGKAAASGIQKTLRASSFFGDLSTEGQKAANSLVLGLRSKFAQTQGKLKEQFAAGAIDAQTFKAAGAFAASQFDQGIRKGLDQLRSQGLATADIVQGLTDQFKNVGLKASDTVRRSITSHPLFGDMSQQGVRAASNLLSGLEAEYNKRIVRLREQFAARVISVHQFRTSGTKAANDFDVGLKTGLDKLRGQGLISPEVADKMVSQFKLAGLKAANAFQLSVDHQLGSNVARLGGMLTASLTLPILAAGAAALKLGADFELAMKSVQVRLDPTKDQMEALTRQARELGNVSQFSATDAAQAQVKLASQAFDTREILTIMPQVVNVAASSFVDLATAAQLSGRVMRGFGQTAEDLNKSMDVLVQTSLKGQGIENVANAFITAGPSARQASLAFTEVAASLALLGQAGLIGERGGTALRNIITRLQKTADPTSKAGKALRDLGIDSVFADGKLKSLTEVIKDFEIAQARAGGNTEQFTQRLNAIFETRTKTGFAVLLAAGSKGLEQFQQQAEAAGGTAQKVGDVQMAGLTGALRELESVAQELALAIVDSGLLKSFTEMVRGFANMIRGLSALPPEFLNLTVKIAALAAVIGPLLFTFAKLSIAISLVKSALILLNGTAGFAGLAAIVTPGGLLIVGLAALAAVFLKVAGNAAAAAAAQREFQDSIGAKSITELKALQQSIAEQLATAETMKTLAEQKAKAENVLPARAIGSRSSALIEGEKRNIAELQQRLDAVNRQLKAMQNLAIAPATPKQTVDPLKATVDLLGELDLDNIIGEGESAMEKMQKQTALLLGLLNLVKTDFATMPGLADDLATQYAKVNKLIDAQGKGLTQTKLELLSMRAEMEKAFRETGVVAVNVDEAKTRKALENLFSDVTPLKFKIALTPSIDTAAAKTLKNFIDSEMDRFTVIANQAAGAKINLELALKVGDTEAIKIAAEQYEAALKRAGEAEKFLADNIVNANLPFEKKKELLEKINELLKEYGISSKEANAKTRSFREDLDGLSSAITGILNVADSFDLMGERAREAVGHVNDLLRSVRDFQQASAAGSFFGQVGSVVGVVGSLVSVFASLTRPTQAQVELTAIQRKNNEELSKLRLELRNFRVDSLSDVTRVQSALPRVSTSLREVAGESALRKQALQMPLIFDRFVKGFGTSLEEITAVAKAFGIEIFDKQGNIIFSQLTKLGEAIELNVQKLIRFGTSLEDQASRLELRRNVFNLDDTGIGAIQDQIKLLGDFAPLLADMFKGLDSTTAAGRAQIEKALQDLFDKLDKGILKPEDFGALGGAEDLAGIIAAIANALDSLKDSVDKTTEALTNVPQGLKVNRLRFEAALADVTLGVTGTRLTATPATPPTVPNTVNNTTIYQVDNINIQGSDKSSQQLADELVRELQLRAKAKTGQSKDWSKIRV